MADISWTIRLRKKKRHGLGEQESLITGPFGNDQVLYKARTHDTATKGSTIDKAAKQTKVRQTKTLQAMNEEQETLTLRLVSNIIANTGTTDTIGPGISRPHTKTFNTALDLFTRWQTHAQQIRTCMWNKTTITMLTFGKTVTRQPIDTTPQFGTQGLKHRSTTPDTDI